MEVILKRTEGFPAPLQLRPRLPQLLLQQRFLGSSHARQVSLTRAKHGLNGVESGVGVVMSGNKREVGKVRACGVGVDIRVSPIEASLP